MTNQTAFVARRRLARSSLVVLICTALFARLVLSALLPARPATAAEPRDGAPARPKKAMIATSLVTPLFGAYYLEGKVRASQSFAAVINASYLAVEKDDWTTRAGTIGIGAEYFFQGDALRRWYVEAIGEVWLASPRHGPSGAVAPFAPGYAGIALIGYQFTFDRGPVLDVGLGVVAFHVPGGTVDTPAGPVSTQASTTIYPAPKVNVGWAF